MVLGFVEHADPDIHLAVAHALSGFSGDPTDPAAVDGLIKLMTHRSAEVRDWSTFGLGVLTDADGPAVRHALWARLDDTEGTTAGEAFVGLARRQDRTIVQGCWRSLSEPMPAIWRSRPPRSWPTHGYFPHWNE